MKNNKMENLKNIKLNQKSKAFIMFIITFAILFGISMIIYCLAGTAEATGAESKDKTIIETNFVSQPIGGETSGITIDTLDYQTTPVSTIKTKEEFISLGEFRCTAYCGCEKCCGKYGKNRPKDENGKDIVFTASGDIAVEGITVAADTSIFPFGTELYINGHKFVVQDVGSVIKENRIDFYFNDHETAKEFGVKYLEVFVKAN